MRMHNKQRIINKVYMNKKIYVAPCNQVIDSEAVEMLASSNYNSFDVSDGFTEDNAVM